MNNKNRISRNLQYYGAIALSGLGIALALVGALMLLNDMNDLKTLAEGGTPENTVKLVTAIVFIAAAIISYKPLEIWRKTLRDEVEYDENGTSRKYGSFMNLSAEERKQLEKQKLLDNERILDTPTMQRITHKGEADPDEAMKKLIGLPKVKEQMREMAARMQYELEEYRRKNKKIKKGQTIEHSSMHMCFYGPPGTGKTTCARIMAGYLYKYRYIRKNQCIEVDGNFFRGLSAGESSKKAKMLITRALGGVLFIDEAYSILSSGEGQEVLATIVKEMEDHRDDIVFIFAGYDKEMRALLNANPGLTSRIKYNLWFGNYTVNDLSDIFRYMAGTQNFVVSADMDEAFRERIAKEARKPNFGNARTVRTLLEKMIDRHATNIMDHVLTEEDRYTLHSCDMPAMEEI